MCHEIFCNVKMCRGSKKVKKHWTKHVDSIFLSVFFFLLFYAPSSSCDRHRKVESRGLDPGDVFDLKRHSRFFHNDDQQNLCVGSLKDPNVTLSHLFFLLHYFWSEMIRKLQLHQEVVHTSEKNHFSWPALCVCKNGTDCRRGKRQRERWCFSLRLQGPLCNI